MIYTCVYIYHIHIHMIGMRSAAALLQAGMNCRSSLGSKHKGSLSGTCQSCGRGKSLKADGTK